jgi:hypothetical protein
LYIRCDFLHLKGVINTQGVHNAEPSETALTAIGLMNHLLGVCFRFQYSMVYVAAKRVVADESTSIVIHSQPMRTRSGGRLCIHNEALTINDRWDLITSKGPNIVTAEDAPTRSGELVCARLMTPHLMFNHSQAESVDGVTTA